MAQGLCCGIVCWIILSFKVSEFINIHMATLKQLQKAKHKIRFCSYLYKLCDSNGFGEMMIQKYFPGLQECITCIDMAASIWSASLDQDVQVGIAL